MLPSVLITFRETLEAALVVGIILTLLTKTDQPAFKKFVWRGVFVGIVISILLALAIEMFFGGLEGKVEELFEGILMFVTVGFLTWMILWVHRQQDVAKRIRQKVALHAKSGYGWGIFLLTSTSVFREGTEMVLYLKALAISSGSNQIFGGVLGLFMATVLGLLIFNFAMRVNLSTVFNITSVFLLLFAAGLVSHGVHEFQEAGLLPIFSFDPIINISWILDHKSTLGSFFRTLFGYTSKPTLFEALSYGSYITFIFWLERFTDRFLTKNTVSS